MNVVTDCRGRHVGSVAIAIPARDSVIKRLRRALRARRQRTTICALSEPVQSSAVNFSPRLRKNLSKLSDGPRRSITSVAIRWPDCCGFIRWRSCGSVWRRAA